MDEPPSTMLWRLSNYHMRNISHKHSKVFNVSQKAAFSIKNRNITLTTCFEDLTIIAAENKSLSVANA